MKKLLKFCLWTAVLLLAALLAALLTCPLWLGPVGKSAANGSVPSFTGTDFYIGDLSINPYTGHMRLERMRLANPDGCQVPDALSVEGVDVDLDVSTLLSDTVRIRNITIESPYVSYVKDATGTNNFDRIIAHAKAKAKAGKTGPDEAREKGPGKKVVIDRLTVSGTRVKVSILPEMPIPTITLRDIGKASGGATMAEVGEAILSAAQGLMTSIGGRATSALGAVGAGATNALIAAGSLVSDAGSELKGKAEAVIGGASTNLLGGAGKAMDGATGLIKGAAERSQSAAQSAVSTTIDIGKTVGNGAMDAGKAVGSGAMDAGKAVGKGAMDAGKAIGDGAKDALKKVGEILGK